MHARILILVSMTLVLAQAATASADGVLPATATPVQREQAQARFLRGKDLMAKKQYDDALGEFLASHEIVASPNTRLETARCLLAMGRVIAAYAELGRVAVEAKELTGQDNRYRRAYDAATGERAEIESKLGFVSLTIENPSDETRVTIGGEEIRRAAWTEPAPVPAGSAPIVVSTTGHRPIEQVVTVAAGQKASLVIDAQSGARDAVEPPSPPVPPEPPPPSVSRHAWMRPGAYVAGGVGAVGLATFVTFGMMARSSYDDLSRACGGGPCGADRVGEISSGKTNQAIANVGLVLAIVGAGAGITLFVLSARENHASNVALAVSPGWIGMRGNL